MTGVTFLLAFTALPAGHSRQRVRCARTGRFVRWSLAPSLRVDGVSVTVSPVAVEALAAPVAVVVAVPVAGGEAQVVSVLRTDSPTCEASGSVPVSRRGFLARAAQAIRSTARRVAGAVVQVAGSLARVASGKAARVGLAIALAGGLASSADFRPGGSPRSILAAQARTGSDRGGTA